MDLSLEHILKIKLTSIKFSIIPLRQAQYDSIERFVISRDKDTWSPDGDSIFR